MFHGNKPSTLYTLREMAHVSDSFGFAVADGTGDVPGLGRHGAGGRRSREFAGAGCVERQLVSGSKPPGCGDSGSQTSSREAVVELGHHGTLIIKK